MISDINFLLVGNSRLHWAKYSKNESKFFHTKKEQKVPENIDLDQLIWASVGKLPNFLLKKDLLIADFGTILSLTKLNSNGVIIGGQLIPGFLTQLKSMEQNTKNLKVPKKYKIPTKDFLMKTEEAILKGVINSLNGFIKCSFNPINDVLITCGGDSQFLTKALETNKKNIINSPNLVMEGMIIHHLSIKQLI